MKLPDDFQFSQSNLQDFVDCPAPLLPQARPAAALSRAGKPSRCASSRITWSAAREFHHLVHQHGIGIPADALEATIPDEVIAAWWQNYRAHAPDRSAR